MPRRADGFAHRWRVGVVVMMLATSARPLRAQQAEQPPAVMRALDLESAGKLREAAALFRATLRERPTAEALLGLERVYAELQMSDSLLAPLDSLIARRPREALYRTVQLRTLQILRRDDGLRDAFIAWTRASPREVAPYREYARVLIALGRPALADSVVQQGRRAVGSGRELAYETAQLRAAQGQWEASATAWRQALADAPYLASAAAYALAPMPAARREAIRVTFRALPAELGARRALAELELSWGRPQEAWDALRVVPADSAAATAWSEFGERAFDEERFVIARDALAASLAVRPSPDVALHAAIAALRSGDPARVFTLAPLGDPSVDSLRLVRDRLPLHVEALAALGRVTEAEALVTRYDRALAPGQRLRLSRMLASAYVRAGDLPRARAALASDRGAAGDDSSEASGWLALYEGRLGAARAMLTTARDPGPELAFALGIVARTRGADGPELGAAFLALARGDSAGAASKFVDAAARHPEAATALLLAAARLTAARHDDAGASALWSRLVAGSPDSPEAVEAELEWARALRRRGAVAEAIAHLEHLILGAPQSALLPQARRELDLARAALPVRQ